MKRVINIPTPVDVSQCDDALIVTVGDEVFDGIAVPLGHEETVFHLIEQHGADWTLYIPSAWFGDE